MMSLKPEKRIGGIDSLALISTNKSTTALTVEMYFFLLGMDMVTTIKWDEQYGEIFGGKTKAVYTQGYALFDAKGNLVGDKEPVSMTKKVKRPILTLPSKETVPSPPGD